MPVDVLVGYQWGDEGKGKLIGPLMKRNGYEACARYQGGNNAGHTVYYKGQKIVFKQVPSGIVVPDTYAVMGNGMVVNLRKIDEDELAVLRRLGIDYEDRLFISDKAHLILPHHAESELVSNESKRIDTTNRGIGPAYTDKAARRGIRVGELVRALSDHDKRKELVDRAGSYVADPMTYIYEQLACIEPLSGNVRDTSVFLNRLIQAGHSILAEGAQGTFLDIDHGTYPFVTSSSAAAGGAFTGLGISPNEVGDIYGVFKAYTTRVGAGPFPTELTDETGRRLGKRGNEFGSVTGRPRRCGWLDLQLLRYAQNINGSTGAIMTKLDVLDEEGTIKVCVGYEGLERDEVPSLAEDLARVRPIYKELSGWYTSTDGITDWHRLPERAKDYAKFIKDETGLDMAAISTGPNEEDLLWL